MSKALRSGFTLIEMLAVILIISILASFLVPMVIDAVAASKTTACQANLRNIYQALQTYELKYRQLPSESGIRFFAQLYKMKAMENTETNARRLTCPAVNIGSLTIGNLPWEEWWTDLDRLEANCSAYAGRDCKNHPLRKLSGSEPLVGDDNDPEMNHDTTTNVLYGDGSVHTFEIELLREEGKLGPDVQLLIVGPGSPVDDLTKLRLD
jgi:prepilin-type N-terminal cleavage/methylation domain-containing protein/prepilin-type processing-associated H-X9-DG protein